MSDTAKIVSMVNEKILKGLPFTAFSVTTELRKQSSEHHGDVRKEVHRLFKAGQMQGYLRESIVNPNSPDKCFLYYPPSLDPKDPALLAYIFSNGPEVSALKNVTPAAPAAALPAPVTPADPADDDAL